MAVVSVIVPVYNSKETLDRCVTSVLNQTLKDFELILADDGGEDGSLNLEKSYAESDPRVKVLELSHGGVSAARNAGIAEAGGDFVIFIDSDDWIEPETLMRAVYSGYAYQTDMVVWDFVYETNEGKYITTFPHENGVVSIRGYADSVAENLNMTQLAVWNKLYRTDIIRSNKISFPAKPLWEDACFVLDYLSCIESVSVLHKSMYHYMDVKTSATYRISEQENDIHKQAIASVLTHLDHFFESADKRDAVTYQNHLQQVYQRVLELMNHPEGLRAAILTAGR